MTRERAELYRRVDARVDGMLAAGLEEEVRAFLAEGLGPDRIAMQAQRTGGRIEVLELLVADAAGDIIARPGTQ